MRHPHDGRSLCADALEQIAVIVDRKIRPAVLPMFGFSHFPAREMRHKLHPVANAKHRNALVEEFLGNTRRLLLIDAGGAARQYDALRAIGENSRQRNRAGQNLRVDLRFANAACDQLGVLRAKVEDQNSIVPEFHEDVNRAALNVNQKIWGRRSTINDSRLTLNEEITPNPSDNSALPS